MSSERERGGERDGGGEREGGREGGGGERKREREKIPEVRMQRSLDVHLLPRLRAALYNLEVARHRPPLRVRHGSRPLVADPGVGSPSPAVHPQHVLEAKVLRQRGLHHLDRHHDECPAFVADVGGGAAGPDRVVVCEINVEDELFGYRPEGGLFDERFAVARVGRVDGADFETEGKETEDFFAETVEGKDTRVLVVWRDTLGRGREDGTDRWAVGKD